MVTLKNPSAKPEKAREAFKKGCEKIGGSTREHGALRMKGWGTIICSMDGDELGLRIPREGSVNGDIASSNSLGRWESFGRITDVDKIESRGDSLSLSGNDNEIGIEYPTAKRRKVRAEFEEMKPKMKEKVEEVLEALKE